MLSCDPKTVREAKAEVRRFLADDSRQLLALPREGICGIFTSPFWALRLLWSALMLGLAGPWFVPQFLKRWLMRRAGVRIGRNAYFSPHVVIDPLFPSLIEIGDHCLLGEGCRVWAHDITATELRIGRVKIGDTAVVGGCAMVHCGITIGEGATVGACSLVTRDVPPGVSVLGVPARRIPTPSAAPGDAAPRDGAPAEAGEEDGS